MLCIEAVFIKLSGKKLERILKFQRNKPEFIQLRPYAKDFIRRSLMLYDLSNAEIKLCCSGN